MLYIITNDNPCCVHIKDKTSMSTVFHLQQRYFNDLHISFFKITFKFSCTEKFSKTKDKIGYACKTGKILQKCKIQNNTSDAHRQGRVRGGGGVP